VVLTKKKNILYLTHGNNDLDHYLPILHNLNGKSEYEQTLLYIYEKNKVLANELHQTIISKLLVNHISLNDLSAYQKTLNIISKIEKYCQGKIEVLNKGDVGGLKTNFVNLFRGLNILITHTFDFIKTILFPKHLFPALMEKNSISLVIVDTLHVSKENASKDPLSYALYHLLQAAKNKNIPIFMISHGTTIRYDKSQPDKIVNGQIFPDRLALCNDMETARHLSLYSEHTLTAALGDIRYDAQWN